MAITLHERIEIKIQTEEKTSVYPLVVKLELSAEDKAALETFRAEIEEKYKEITDAAERSSKLARTIARVKEDIEDITEEIAEAGNEEDKKRYKKLRKTRRELRRRLREAEDALATLEERYDLSAYTDAKTRIVEDIAKKSFEINVVDDERKAALEKAIDRLGIKYAVVTEEIGRLIEEAKRKKKKRS